MAGLKSYGKACWYFGINCSWILNVRCGDRESPRRRCACRGYVVDTVNVFNLFSHGWLVFPHDNHSDIFVPHGAEHAARGLSPRWNRWDEDPMARSGRQGWRTEVCRDRTKSSGTILNNAARWPEGRAPGMGRVTRVKPTAGSGAGGERSAKHRFFAGPRGW